jgi:kynureninase
MLVACVKPSLEVFRDAGGVARLRRKSLLLTAYLEALLHTLRLTVPSAFDDSNRGIEIVTPTDPLARGCQLSLRVVSPDGAAPMTMHQLNEALDAAGVIADEREPDVIRIAPTPLYNSFTDVFRFAHILAGCLRLESK